MSTHPTSISRSSTSKPNPPPVKSDPTALLHPSVTITGIEPVELSRNVIVQLRARISTAYAPLTIFDGALISERVSLGYLSPPLPSSPSHITIGAHTIIESGAVVEAASIGSCCVIEAGARIGKGAILGDGCKVCALVEVGEGEFVGDGEVVYGSGSGERRVERGMEKGGEGRKLRLEMAEKLGELYKRLWTGK